MLQCPERISNPSQICEEPRPLISLETWVTRRPRREIPTWPPISGMKLQTQEALITRSRTGRG